MQGQFLLPNVNQQWYNRWITDNQNEEGWVNGTWNAILSSFYPTNVLDYTISPEVYLQGARGRIDLLVSRNLLQNGAAIGVWQIIYEGKGGLSQDQFPDILDQLERYAADLVNDREVYLIGARGDQVMFWQYTKSRGRGYSQGIELVRDTRGNLQPHLMDTGNLPPQWDMITEQPQIRVILQAFADNPK